MHSHDPFGYLKHKLWPKERLKVKLVVWLLTTKSQESPSFTCVQVMCHILLKSSQQGLKLCFGFHLNLKSTKEITSPQSGRSPNFKNFRTPTWESYDKKNDIWVLVLWLDIENTIRGKVVISPKFMTWWVLWIRVCPWLVRAPKMLQLHITQLVV
jgi:hypothetical protein